MRKEIMIIGILLFCLYLFDQSRRVRTEFVTIEAEGIHTPVRILQLTDFHSNSWINTTRLAEEIQLLDPDLIVMTGDMAEENLKPVEKLFSDLKTLEKDIFVVLGNHDERMPIRTKYEQLIRETGATFLDNEAVIWEKGDQRINVIGLAHSNLDSKQAYQQADPKAYNLILVHSPTNMLRHLDGREDLILCGHTHGGQVRLPLIGAVLVPGQPLFNPPMDRGVFQLTDRTTLYVDSGIGNTLLPLRTLNRVQMSLLTIQ
ncbi:MAG: metallophosphoesterase [Tissierellia bacterium]|nr:metallophosphoesterase [Tissierellia bacterium]